MCPSCNGDTNVFSYISQSINWNKMPVVWKTIYDYSWGDEDILGSYLIIKRDQHNDEYLIHFEQHGFCKRLFKDVELKGGTLIKKAVNDREDEVGMDVKIIEIHAKMVCNPKPEDIFSLVPVVVDK